MSKCPFNHTQQATVLSAQWWPNQLTLKALDQTPPTFGDAKTYAEEFATLDLAAVKKDIMTLMTTSQDWWPADYGHYGPFFVRMAWHAAGTYRTSDGRGGAGQGMLRFAPLNSWPDNGNLDKARRLLWPIKQKYGRKLSWSDLLVFTGNCAIESMGLEPFGFGGGRIDAWEPEEDVYWGPEETWLSAERGGLGDKLEQPLGAVQMGLIYVNPEGPGGKPDPLLAAHDIRTTFGRMAMNDEETVALIAGGHTFGKAHGAADPSKHVGPAPEGAPIEEQGLGWKNSYKSGKGAHTITSGLEGAWTANPAQWDHAYFEYLFKYDWEQTKSPAGATQWVPKDKAAAKLVPDAHDPSKKHAPIMFTTDLALKMDPAYKVISKKFLDDPKAFGDAFAKAWYKLTHRDLGPQNRLLGPYVPPPQLWQDPLPPAPTSGSGAVGSLSASQLASLKSACLMAPGVSVASLVKCAWASASSYRATDRRGGANGARLLLAPQKDWPANDPSELAPVLAALESIRQKSSSGISMADMIVLAGCAGVEAAAKAAGHASVEVPFIGGRTDATQEMTDEESFAVLEPIADGFRNYDGRDDEKTASSASGKNPKASAEVLLVEKARMLNLSKAEMAVLVGGMRVMGATHSTAKEVGLLTATPGQLNNAYFVNLLDLNTEWVPAKSTGKDLPNLFVGKDRATGQVKWSASRCDLVFGSHGELRAVAEHYACDDGQAAFVKDFVQVWAKVMNLDRYDLLNNKIFNPASCCEIS